jgi:hypothetical protein
MNLDSGLAGDDPRFFVLVSWTTDHALQLWWGRVPVWLSTWPCWRGARRSWWAKSQQGRLVHDHDKPCIEPQTDQDGLTADWRGVTQASLCWRDRRNSSSTTLHYTAAHSTVSLRSAQH